MSTVTIAHVTRIAHELYAQPVTPEHIVQAGVTSPNAATLHTKGTVNLHEGKNLATIVNLTVKAAGFKGAVKPKSDPVWATLLADCETRNRSEGAKKAQPAKSKTPAKKGATKPDATLTKRVDSLEAKLDLILAALAPKS